MAVFLIAGPFLFLAHSGSLFINLRDAPSFYYCFSTLYFASVPPRNNKTLVHLLVGTSGIFSSAGVEGLYSLYIFVSLDVFFIQPPNQ